MLNLTPVMGTILVAYIGSLFWLNYEFPDPFFRFITPILLSVSFGGMIYSIGASRGFSLIFNDLSKLEIQQKADWLAIRRVYEESYDNMFGLFVGHAVIVFVILCLHLIGIVKKEPNKP